MKETDNFDYSLTPFTTSPEMDNITNLNYSFRQSIVDKMLLAEEDLIKKVLFNLTNREITLEDAKHCQKITHVDYPNRYMLVFGDMLLGMVFKNMYGFHFDASVRTFI